MEKKYYFRGLGLGIVVTAIIMGIALPHGTKTREMTDDEVIARAKELGMTEDTRLLEPGREDQDGEDETALQETPVKKDIAVKTDISAASEAEEAKETEKKPTVDTPEPVETETSAASPETTKKTDTNEMRKQDDDGDGTTGEEQTDSVPEETKEEENANTLSAGMKTVVIVGGDGSYTVAKKLEDAGVVSSASSYDTYLCENGYDKKLRPGTFQIPAGANDEQIARIVTGQQ